VLHHTLDLRTSLYEINLLLLLLLSLSFFCPRACSAFLHILVFFRVQLYAGYNFIIHITWFTCSYLLITHFWLTRKSNTACVPSYTFVMSGCPALHATSHHVVPLSCASAKCHKPAEPTTVHLCRRLSSYIRPPTYINRRARRRLVLLMSASRECLSK